MSLEQRAARRRQTIQVHRAKNFSEAERWDLEFWQAKSPEERLSALIAILDDVRKAEEAGQDKDD